MSKVTKWGVVSDRSDCGLFETMCQTKMGKEKPG